MSSGTTFFTVQLAVHRLDRRPRPPFLGLFKARIVGYRGRVPLQLPHRAYVSSQLVASLREAMSRGEWQERLPSERMLAEMLKVSRMTLRKALAQLEAEGLIAPSPVCALLPITPQAPPSPHGSTITVSIVRRPYLLAVSDLDLWQHRLQLRLAQLGIP